MTKITIVVCIIDSVPHTSDVHCFEQIFVGD